MKAKSDAEYRRVSGLRPECMCPECGQENRNHQLGGLCSECQVEQRLARDARLTAMWGVLMVATVVVWMWVAWWVNRSE